MQWKGRRSSNNIEDRRSRGGGMPGGMRGGGMRGGSVAGVGGLGVVAVFVISILFGVDPRALLDQLNGGAVGPGPGASAPITAEDEQAAEFVSVVLADTEEIWTRLFADQLNLRYNPPTLVLFKDGTQSPCGGASAATGPFYCPADNKVYLDTGFFVTMEHQLGAKGDFAAAYVVAHEVGHHIQDELGILEEANAVRARVSEAESNRISVQIELQADCLSGIWAREAAQSLGVVDSGDFEEALNAARQIGDDTLQRAAGQRPMPHTFTHGSSEQRQRWFTTGLNSGRLKDCDTFAAGAL